MRLRRMAAPLCVALFVHVQQGRVLRPSGPQLRTLSAGVPCCFAAGARAARVRGKTTANKRSLALLVDGDQYGPKQCQLLVDFLDQSYDVRVRRIYAAPSKAETWRRPLAEASFDFVAVPRWTGGQKDPVDMEIAMDVIEMAMSKELCCLAVACADVDYARVFQRGRELGQDMLHVVPAGTNALPEVPAEIAASCSQTLVVKRKEDGKAGKAERYQVTPAEQEVRDCLADLGYWDPKSGLARRYQSRCLRQAIACFVHVNDISSLRGSHPFFPPRTVTAQLREIVSRKQQWKSKPDGLLCLTGCNSRHNHPTLGMKFSNWPFVDCFEFATDNLAERVLRAFGYLDSWHNVVEQEARTFFVKRQATKRTSHDNEMLAALKSADWSELHRLFTRDDLLQEWCLPRKDTQLRLDLRRLGYLDSKASKGAIMGSMKRFLEAQGVKVPANYHFRVWHCLELLHAQPCPDRRREWTEEISRGHVQ
ncbi:unnamed protein product [Effrenium voratum]|uniref:NYN domain-containing protein n=1 Tax=Effrenium voratum TaxID=2562239 RepID=A0AA36JT47_9DINO|nr:unnamed protein product [Effrenium voratum]CAJ1416654.1 unnamed protein product [Effrenium voratum]